MEAASALERQLNLNYFGGVLENNQFKRVYKL